MDKQSEVVCSVAHNYDFNKIARTIYGTLKFWQAVRFEQYEPQVFRGEKWSMNPFRQFFNSAQIPGLEKDNILYGFNTMYEKPKTKSRTDQFGLLINGSSYRRMI